MKTKRLGQLTLALASAALLGGVFGAECAGAATYDTVYYGGKIYTMTEDTQDGKNMRALDPSKAIKVEAVGVKDGKIVYTGALSGIDLKDAAKVVDLHGKTMLPGFIDGHGHFPQQGARDLYEIDLGSPPLGTMTSIADYQAALKTACDNPNQDPAGIVGVGYDDTLIEDMRHVNAADIEAVCPGKRVRLSHISGHVAVASYALLEEGGLISDSTGTATKKAEETTGVEINKDGKVTGVLFETVAMNAVPTPNPAQDAQKSLARASEVFLSKGVTLADDGATVLGYTPSQYQEGWANGNLNLRVAIHPFYMPLSGTYGYLTKLNFQMMGWQNLPENPMPGAQEYLDSGAAPSPYSPRIGDDVTNIPFTGQPLPAELKKDLMFLGAFKILGDGSPQAYTAWMKDPGFYDWGDYTVEDRDTKRLAGTKYDTLYFNGAGGTLNVPPLDLQLAIELAHKHGYSTETHTNGSAYAEAWIEALELAVSKYPDITDTRHTSIHGQTFERDVVERLAGSYDTVNPKMSNQMFGAFGNGEDGTPGDYDASQVNGLQMNQLAERMKAQNFFASFFVTHTYYYGERHRDTFFGPGRAYNISPTGWATAFGLPFSLHNDNTVTPIEPLQSVESAVTRLSAKSFVSEGGQPIYYTGPQAKDNVDATDTFNQRKIKGVESDQRDFYVYDQRVNVLQALHAVTINPAYQNKISDRVGSIAKGKYADFVILDDDPIVVAENDPTKLSEIRVASTIVNDDVKYGVLPDATSFASDMKPSYSYGTSGNDVITVQEAPKLLEGEDAEKMHDLEKGHTRLACFTFTVNFDKNELTDEAAVFQMNMLGNGKTVEDILLYDVVNNATVKDFTLTETSETTSHKYWIADQKAPMMPLSKKAALNMDASYIVYFSWNPRGRNAAPEGQNDQIATLADEDNVITIDLVSKSGTQPENNTSALSSNNSGSSSGGCTVGTKPAYDLTILLGMLVGVAGLRGLRRRFFSASNK